MFALCKIEILIMALSEALLLSLFTQYQMLSKWRLLGSFQYRFGQYLLIMLTCLGLGHYLVYNSLKDTKQLTECFIHSKIACFPERVSWYPFDAYPTIFL